MGCFESLPSCTACSSAKMQKKSPFSLSGVFYTLLSISIVFAQPSPNVQKRISQAIATAANQTDIDYTAFVNPFIGTGMFNI